MKKAQIIVVFAAVAMLLVGVVWGVSADADSKAYDVSIAAIVPTAGESSFLGGDVLVTGFEVADGFATGYCEQNGWTAFIASTTEGHIDTANPATGTQHMRISADTSIPVGTLTGCFSPLLATPATTPTLPMSQTSVDVYISDSGGADYDVAPQAPSQGFLTARVKFSFTGNIEVLADVGAGLAFQDTGVDWTPATWHNLVIEADPENNVIDYIIDGTSIYTSTVIGGTVVEQVVILSDNFHFNDAGDFDNVNIDNVYAPIPTDVALTSFGGNDAASNALFAAPVLLALLGGAFIVMRRRTQIDV